MPKVKSSNLAHVEYDAAAKELIVEFTDGSKYAYEDVPSAKYSNLMTAPSKGEYFYARIRGMHKYTKLG